jgi:hypothetical protein
MPEEATKTDALLRLARKGPVRARDLDEAGIPRAYLRRLCDRGILERVDRGIYRLADAPVTELHSLAEVAVRVPHATVCLLSALRLGPQKGDRSIFRTPCHLLVEYAALVHPTTRHHVLTCPSSTRVGYAGDGIIHPPRATLRRAGHERV